MKKTIANPIVSHLKSLRLSKGLTQTQLAEGIGVKRQAIYDMESGRYLPNTVLALRLAEILECRVEDIFALNDPSREPSVTLMAPALSDGDTRLAMARIRGKLIGFPLTGRDAVHEGILPADALYSKKSGRFRLVQPETALEQRALLLGCDPAFGLLGAHLSRTHGAAAILCRFASSQSALEALSRGHTHIAGTHQHAKGGAEPNVAFARQILGDFKGLVVGFSRFEEGLMVAPGNPINIFGVPDLARNDVRMVNREPGAALRSLLEDCLATAGIPVEAVRGFDDRVSSHSEGAQQVLFGKADAALGLRVVATVHGLDFINLSTVRCDLFIPDDLMELQSIKVLLDVMQSGAFRQDLNHLPGYDASDTGKVVFRR
ncbi:MAG: substrate-binding domain-containing protein [Desulfobacteraceae bacterium]